MCNKVTKNNLKKIIALLIIVAIGFVLWKEPIQSKANEADIVATGSEQENEGLESFRIDLDNGSYMDYKVTDDMVTCIYYECVGIAEDGSDIYRTKSTTMEIMTEEDEEESLFRGGPLYWKKTVKDKLKRDYSYQAGVQGTDMFYKIAWEKQAYVINYTALEDTTYVDEYIKLLDSVNKQIIQCLAVAVGAVMIAIAAIIASYCTVGAMDTMTAVSGILNKLGVKLLQLSPIGFGRMVFKLYDDYVELEKKFAMAATYGIAQ